MRAHETLALEGLSGQDRRTRPKLESTCNIQKSGEKSKWTFQEFPSYITSSIRVITIIRTHQTSLRRHNIPSPEIQQPSMQITLLSITAAIHPCIQSHMPTTAKPNIPCHTLPYAPHMFIPHKPAVEYSYLIWGVPSSAQRWKPKLFSDGSFEYASRGAMHAHKVAQGVGCFRIIRDWFRSLLACVNERPSFTLPSLVIPDLHGFPPAHPAIFLLTAAGDVLVGVRISVRDSARTALASSAACGFSFDGFGDFGLGVWCVSCDEVSAEVRITVEWRQPGTV